MNTMPLGETGIPRPTPRQIHDYVCRMVLDELVPHADDPAILLPCRLRVCRRRGLCCGPLVEHALSESEMRYFRERRLGNCAVAAMPACLANARELLRHRIFHYAIPDMIGGIGPAIDVVITRRLRNLKNRARRRLDKRWAWKRARSPSSSGVRQTDP